LTGTTTQEIVGERTVKKGSRGGKSKDSQREEKRLYQRKRTASGGEEGRRLSKKKRSMRQRQERTKKTNCNRKREVRRGKEGPMREGNSKTEDHQELKGLGTGTARRANGDGVLVHLHKNVVITSARETSPYNWKKNDV